MNTPVVGDEITIVLASRCYRGRVAEVSGGPYIFGNRATKLSVSLANDIYTGTYWFGIHEESLSWFRGWGDDIEAAFLLQRSAVG